MLKNGHTWLNGSIEVRWRALGLCRLAGWHAPFAGRAVIANLWRERCGLIHLFLLAPQLYNITSIDQPIFEQFIRPIATTKSIKSYKSVQEYQEEC